MEEQTFCVICHAPTRQPATGRSRLTCSNACRQKLYRLRHRNPHPEHAAVRREGRKLIRFYERRYGELHWRVKLRLMRGIPLLECIGCGRPFIDDGPGPVRKYCSPRCRDRYYARERRLDRAVEHARATGRLDGCVAIRRRFGGVPPICAHCGIPFTWAAAFGRQRIYCSDRCRKQAYEKRWERRHGRKRTHRYKKCPNCGQRFDTYTSRGQQRRKFCSPNCKWAYLSRAARRRAREKGGS